VTCFRKEYQEVDVLMKQELDFDNQRLFKFLEHSTNHHSDSYLLNRSHQFIKVDDSNEPPSLYVVPSSTYMENKYRLDMCELDYNYQTQILKMFMNYLKSLILQHSDDPLYANFLASQSMLYRLYVMFCRAKDPIKSSILYRRFKSKVTPAVFEKANEDALFALWLRHLQSCVSELIKEKKLLVGSFAIQKFDPKSKVIFKTLDEEEKMYKIDYEFLKQHSKSFESLKLSDFCSFSRRVSHRGATLFGRYDNRNAKLWPTEQVASMTLLQQRLASPVSSFQTTAQRNSWSFIGDDCNDNSMGVTQLSFFSISLTALTTFSLQKFGRTIFLVKLPPQLPRSSTNV